MRRRVPGSAQVSGTPGTAATPHRPLLSWPGFAYSPELWKQRDAVDLELTDFWKHQRSVYEWIWLCGGRLWKSLR